VSGSRQTGRWRRFALLWLVFSSGVAVMGLEMSASRLIAPFFGTTLSVWTCLIGLVLAFLTVGYYVGGALADRHPSAGLLGGIVLVAGLLTLALPLVSTRVLEAAWSATPRAGLLAGSLLGTFALFSLPTLLLGCVCPFALKLSLLDLGRAGRDAGRIYAVSAIGSVVGTFLPALVTIPALGVRHSIMLFGALLVLAALLLLGRARFAPALAALAVFLVPLSPLLPARGVLESRESPYNYLQVVEAGGARMLIVDWGVFSAHRPGEFRTHEYYDYLLLAPLLRPGPASAWLHRVLIIGLAAGTSAKQITAAYGPVAIDGVEIDPTIVDIGRRRFDMNEPNLRVHVTDGRAFLAQVKEPYDWVIVDAYQGAEIPFHLVTKEFFQALRDHMAPDAVLSINVCWWRPDDEELVGRLVATVGAVFPRVATLTGISRQSGAVLLAGGEHLSQANLGPNAQAVGHAGLSEIAREVAGGEHIKLAFSPGLFRPDVVLTDDRAPVERIADRMYQSLRRDRYQAERAATGL
jgi:spermidine synthase